MAKDIKKKYKELLLKQDLLEKAQQTLKKEFIGIDKVIDEVIEAVSPWFLFPDMQEKPVIINLWGLTGVGKSSLVSRLASLLKFDKKYFHFDLGEKDKQSVIKEKLEEIYDYGNKFPILITLDEFQHAKTLDETGKEIENSTSRIIWQILDSGKFQISKYIYSLDDLYDLVLKLRHMLQNGVQVVNGEVVVNKDFFDKNMSFYNPYHEAPVNENNNKPILFVPKNYHERIYTAAKEKFESRFDVEEKLRNLNGIQTLRFLAEVHEAGSSAKTIDCSQALVFVLGNLDEAYTMSDNFNPDISADEFHESSKRITIPIIKRALQRRFRNEQIARLGNMHVIYPAFNQASFRKIIKLELKKISKKVLEKQALKLHFDTSIVDLIYQEGVYPTQGTRPIFTTIHQLVTTKLGHIFKEVILQKLEPSKIKVAYKDEKVVVTYFQDKQKIHSIKIKQLLNLGELRKNKKDDMQAITAVHESGHAILAALLLNTLPEGIFSNTADVGSAGFVYTRFKWDYIARHEILSRLALFLGGYVAEMLVFGKDNITTGAESDIEKATKFINQMFKECGMSDVPAMYHVKDLDTNLYFHDPTDEIGKEAMVWLKASFKLAVETLENQEELLLKMADHLSDNRTMNKKEIKTFLKKYAKDFDVSTLIEEGDHLFYRKHLKDKIANLQKEKDKKEPLKSLPNPILKLGKGN